MYIMLSKKKETKLCILMTETFQSIVFLYWYVCVLKYARKAMYFPLVKKIFYIYIYFIHSSIHSFILLTTNNHSLLALKIEKETLFVAMYYKKVLYYIYYKRHDKTKPYCRKLDGVRPAIRLNISHNTTRLELVVVLQQHTREPER